LIGAIGWMLRGPWTGVAAAAIYAVVGTGPHIQGFALNGELVACLPATGAVVAAVAWWRGGRDRWLAAAGVLGGSAILMKQGGFDGLVAAAALALVAPSSFPKRARAVGLVAAGAAVPLGAAAIHGLTVGFGTYWSDVVAFRASHDAFESRSHQFNLSLPAARADLLALAIVALIGIAVVARRRTERVLLLAWLLAGLAAFNVGGLFWSHYYVQLVPALAVLAGIAATAVRSRFLAVAVTCAALAPVAVSLIDLGVKPAEAREAAITYGRLFELDEAIAGFIDANSSPADTVYVLDSRADIYWLADRRTRYPYIWHHSPLLTPGGMAQLLRMLARPDRPRIVVLFRNPLHLEPTGVLANAIHRRYKVAWRPAKGVQVLVRRRHPSKRDFSGGIDPSATRWPVTRRAT
jgi:hypothetical protein